MDETQAAVHDLGMRGRFRLIIVLTAAVVLVVFLQMRGVTPTVAPVGAARPLNTARNVEIAMLGRARGAATGDCAAPAAMTAAAADNARSLGDLAWSPFHRPEVGWEIYAPLVGREIAEACPPSTPAFAAALANWQKAHGRPASGRLDPDTFAAMVTLWHARRPFVAASAHGVCPPAPRESDLETARSAEGYYGKPVSALPDALAAYRRMVAAARAERPEIAADPRLLDIFSAYRSPLADAMRCLVERNCDRIVRATCSAHRTGTAFDLFLGSAPGFKPESADDANRLYASRTPTYLWLVWNADRFGFVNYPFEPWHWEWAGKPGAPPSAPHS